MSEIAQQILVVLAFAAVLVGLNLKAGVTWLKVVTLYPALGALGLAAYLVVDWVIA